MSDTTHRCPGPGCERRVSAEMLACSTHWFQVPKPIRDEVWAAYDALDGTEVAEQRHAGPCTRRSRR